MAWTPPARHLRWGMKVPANSIANTAVFSANHRCGIFARCARQMLRRWSPPVAASLYGYLILADAAGWGGLCRPPLREPRRASGKLASRSRRAAQLLLAGEARSA